MNETTVGALRTISRSASNGSSTRRLRARLLRVGTDPQLIPEWRATARSSRRWTFRPGGRYFRHADGHCRGRVPRGRRLERLVQTFQNHLQTLEFEDLGEQTKLTQTMRFATTEERHDDAVRGRGGREARFRGSIAHYFSGYRLTREPRTIASVPSSKRTQALPSPSIGTRRRDPLSTSRAGRGRLAQVIASRGGLAPPEEPFRDRAPRGAGYMLCEAAELEHGSCASTCLPPSRSSRASRRA